LSEGLIDLLQVESTPNKEELKQTQDGAEEPNIDSHPTSTNSKFPPLRRAALHLFNLIVRESAQLMYNQVISSLPLPDNTLKRAKITFAYIASVADDRVMKVMAREGGELIEQLQQAAIGL
jgi:hypothetical protein